MLSREFFKNLQIPHKPGIYVYKDENGGVLYVGKAIDLYHRVSSYFSGPHPGGVGTKTAVLVSQIRSVETIIVESELEALVLEANLIKKYLPPFNIRLTDDKDYLYIKVTKGQFPQVVTARKKELSDSLKYFGPFPSSETVRTTLKKLRRIFPWCSNPPKYDVETDIFILKRPCFYYHLKLCPGTCAGKITPKEYKRTINQLCKFLEGKSNELLEDLEKEMGEAAKDLEFERAHRIKKTIEGLKYLTLSNRTEAYLENPNFLEQENLRAMAELQRDLNLPGLPERIEGYDISNIQGHESTGSMVVLTNGGVDKSQYRKFKIKITGKPNDYAMHSEMMRRRLNHIDEWPLPNLFVIDGGRGQVRAVKKVIEEFASSHPELDSGSIDSRSESRMTGMDVSKIPIYGLAKRMEWLYPPEGEVVKLPKRSLGLRLLQRLRDESHRFAVTYHRKLRSRNFITSLPKPRFLKAGDAGEARLRLLKPGSNLKGLSLNPRKPQTISPRKLIIK